MLIEKIKQNKKRIITGFTLGILALFCVYTGGLPLLLLVFAICYFGTKEYIKILKNKGFLPSFTVILLTEIAFIFLIGIKKYEFIPMIIVLGTIASFCAVLFKGRQPYIVNVATTVLGAIYCGWLPTHFVLIRQLDSTGMGLLHISDNLGLGYILFTFFVVISTDIGAYLFGRKFGKTPLAPVVSPKKTVEGAICGALTSIVVGLILGFIIHLSLFHSFLGALIITITSQIGDLSESLIKRDAGVKDSGNTLPGHGGFLDRTDSFIFAAPIAFYYFKFIVLDNSLWNFINNFLHVSF